MELGLVGPLFNQVKDVSNGTLFRLIPYYHYVPIQTDYSDLHDSLAFFMGAPDGPAGHDELAEKIGMHSHEFAAQHWRREDMQVYVGVKQQHTISDQS